MKRSDFLKASILAPLASLMPWERVPDLEEPRYKVRQHYHPPYGEYRLVAGERVTVGDFVRIGEDERAYKCSEDVADGVATQDCLEWTSFTVIPYNR